MNEWKKIDPDTSETWNYKEDKKLIGIFLEKIENVGQNNSNMYKFEMTDGTLLSVWGTTLLDARFKNLKKGEEVKIIYLGDEKSPKTGRTYHNFEVYHREPKIEETKIKDEIDIEDVPM